MNALLRYAAEHNCNLMDGSYGISAIITTKAVTPDGIIDLDEFRHPVEFYKKE
jgi:hypothetical protein